MCVPALQNTDSNASRGCLQDYRLKSLLFLFGLSQTMVRSAAAKVASPATACIGKPKVRKPRQPKAQPKAECEEGHDEPVDKKQSRPKGLVTNIANSTGVDVKDVKVVLDALPDAIAANLRAYRKLTIPSVCLLKLKDVKGQPESVKKIFNKEVKIPAKPASLRVHPLILKPLKVAVNAGSVAIE